MTNARSVLAVASLLSIAACAGSSLAPRPAASPQASESRPSATARPQRPFPPERLYAIPRVGEPALSPDGTQLLYTVRTVDLAQDRSTAEVHLLVLGSGLSRVDAVVGQGSSPCWLGDGSRYAFFAKDGWHVRDARTNAETVRDLGGETSNLLPSPDGTRVAFTRAVAVETTAKDLHPDLPLASARIHDDLMVRHWDHWLDGTRSHLFTAALAGGDAVDLMPKEPFDTPLVPFGGSEQIAWSPDGASLCYTAKKVADPERSTDSALWLVPSNGGAARCLTEELPGFDQDPAFSPDGRTIAFCSMARAGFEADRVRLMLHDVATGANRELLPDFDASVHELRWTGDGTRLYFTVETEGTTQLYTTSVANPRAVAVTKGRHALSAIQLRADGQKVYALRTAMEQPADLVEIDVVTGAVTELTGVAKDLAAAVDLPSVEAEWFPSSDGKRIHAWILKPPGFDPAKRYPFVLFCQGGPQSMVGQSFSYRWNFACLAAQGYVVAGVNRRGLPGFGQAWNDQISGDWGGQAMQDLLAVTDAMQARPYVDKARSAAVGASFGGFTVYWLMGNAGDRFACMVSHCGVFHLESMYLATEEHWFTNWDLGTPWWETKDGESPMRRFSPHRFVGFWKTPLLVIHGEQDFRVPYDQGLQAFTAAQRMGVPSRLLVFPDEGHWVLKPQNGLLWHREFYGWLSRWCSPR